MEEAAGVAVAEGALIAGPLAKRSDWRRTWNVRFSFGVLTTEQIAARPEGLENAQPSGLE